jgi:DNA topoisomerase-1
VETVLDRGYVERATIPAAPVKLGVLTLTPGPKLKASQRTEKIGGEKDKLRTTPLGRTVMEWLLGQFNDMIEYDFTAEMETQLDEVAKGSRPWSSVLTDTWSRYADRYRTIMSQQQAQTQKSQSANKSDFGDGYKMVVSKKGPLFVLEREGEKTRFASVPAHLSLQTATRADAESAFATTIADSLGILNDKPVERRKGPYGHYVVWGDVKVNCTATETLEEIRPRLEAKVGGDTVDHTIGPYKIRKGPYGLYMFKTGTKGKPTFVSIPDATLWSTLTVEGAGELYTHCSTAKTMAKAKK